MKVVLFLLATFLAGCGSATPLQPTINAYLTVTAPLPNAVLKNGSEVKVSWTCTGACSKLPSGDTIEVDITPDNSTYYPIIVGGALNDEKTWVVGNTLTAVSFTKPTAFNLVIGDQAGALQPFVALTFSTSN